MEKLKLTLDDLVVESFVPADGATRTGTVRANASGPYTDECDSCGQQTGCGDPCDTDFTCPPSPYYTCAGAYTCYETCEGYTCDFGDTCNYPACTAPGSAC